ncbi:MAG: bifunctional adenosylcobinamide kinase/adenosylcobinamide-phosphate guanylyltransferase [Acidimicrobiales bacterium]
MDVATTDAGAIGLTLVLGGTRSGKSEVGERLIVDQAGSGAAVTYLATAAWTTDPADVAWAERFEAHRVRRPATWCTVEVDPGADLGEGLRELTGPVLVDSLGAWLAGFPGFDCDTDRLRADLVARTLAGHGPTVIVSEEVGLGVHPPTEVGIAFADALGTLNRQVASVADRVILVVAGRVLDLPRPEDG